MKGNQMQNTNNWRHHPNVRSSFSFDGKRNKLGGHVCVSIELSLSPAGRFQQSNLSTDLAPKPRWPKKDSSEWHPAHDHEGMRPRPTLHRTKVLHTEEQNAVPESSAPARSNRGTAHDRKATEHCYDRGARGPHVSPPGKAERSLTCPRARRRVARAVSRTRRGLH